MDKATLAEVITRLGGDAGQEVDWTEEKLWKNLQILVGDLELMSARNALSRWQRSAHELSVSKGWWDPSSEKELAAERDTAGIALLHLNLSRMLEAVRTGVNDFEAIEDPEAYLATLSPIQVTMLSKLSLMHSEISETVEAVMENEFYLRKDGSGKPEGAVVELADAVIRIWDFCGAWALNLADAIATKHAFNATRPRKHGGKLV